MGNIDNLNFELIIKDDSFNKKIEEAKKKAKELNTSLSNLLTINKDLATGLGEASREIKGMSGGAKELKQSLKESTDNAKKLSVELASGNSIQKDTNRHAQRQTKTLQEQSAILKQITGLASTYFSVQGVSRFLSTLMRITGEFEVQQQSLRVILNDAQKADVIFERLRQFAVESPYTFQELSSYTKQLAAFDIPAEKLLETNKMLADVAAGLGVSMDRIILAYGHVKSSGFLRGMQLRQFTQNGVPILKELAAILSEVEHKTISVAQVFDKMEKREIPFEYIEEAFKRMTSEGGKFYKMQEVLVETLKGRMGKLRDVWQQSVYDLGQANSGTLKGAVDFAIKFAGSLDTIVKILSPLVAGIGAYGVALATVAAIQKAMNLGQYVRYLALIAKGYRGAQAAIGAFGREAALAGSAGAMAMKSFAGIVGLLGMLVTSGIEIYNVIKKKNQIMDEEAKVTSRVEAEYRSELVSASRLLNKMKGLTAGTEAYNKVKGQLLSQFGKYLTDTDKEAIAVGNLSDVYSHLAENIRAVAREKVVNDVASEASKAYADVVSSITEKITGKKGVFNPLNSKGLSDFRTSREIPVEIEADILSWVLGDTDTISQAIKDFWGDVDITGEFKKGGLGKRNGYFYDLRQQIQSADSALVKAREHAEALAETITGGLNGEDGGIDNRQWVEKVKKALAKLSPDIITKAGLDLQENEGYYDYLERIGKEWKQIKEEKDKALEVDKPAKQAMLDAISAVDRALEGNILKDARYNKEPWNKPDHTETDNEKRIKSRISILGKLKKAYDELISLGTSSKGAMDTMLGFDGFKELKDDILAGNFDERILNLIEELRQTDPNAAEGLSASYGLNAWTQYIKKIKESANEAEKAEKKIITYRDLIQSLTSEDVNVEGKGFWYDLSKISSDLNTKLNKLAVSGQKAKEKLAGLNTGDESAKGSLIKSLLDEGFSQEEADAWWEKWINGGSVAIDAFLAEMADKARAQAGENVTNLAKNYLEETFFANGIDFDNLADRSLMQLETLRSKLLSVTAGLKIGSIDQGFLDANMVDTGNLKGIDLNDTENNAWLETLDEGTVKTLKLMQAVQMAGGSFDDFEGAINKVVKGKLKDLTDEEKKGLASLGKMATDSLGKVASAAKELGEASGNEGLVNASELFEQVNEIGGSIAQGFSQGGIIGAAVAGVTSLATGFLGAAADAARFKNALDELNRQMTLTALRSMINSEEFETVFGTDEYGQVIESVKAANEAFSMYSNTLEKFERNGRKGVEGIKQMKAVTRKGFLGIGRKKKSLGSLVPGLFNDDGTIDRQALETFIDSDVYDRLGDKDKKLLRELLDDMSIYENAIAAMHDYLSSIFGDLGAQISDALTDAFVNGTDAAKAFTDSVGDMLERLGQQIIYSATLGPLLDEAQEAFEKITRDENLNKDQKFEQYAKTLTVLVNGAADAQEDAMRLYKKYKDMAFAAGFDIFNADEEENPDTVGKGITSVTEDTANLLASYLNAVRGDVSVMRLEQTGFFGFMRSQMPTLNDHLARIEAYSYDISQSNARILAEMQSVISNVGSGGTHSVKVELIQ